MAILKARSTRRARATNAKTCWRAGRGRTTRERIRSQRDRRGISPVFIQRGSPSTVSLTAAHLHRHHPNRYSGPDAPRTRSVARTPE